MGMETPLEHGGAPGHRPPPWEGPGEFLLVRRALGWKGLEN